MEKKNGKLNPTSFLMENLVDGVTDNAISDEDPIIKYLKNENYCTDGSDSESRDFGSDDSDIEVLIEEHILLEKLKQVSGKKNDENVKSPNISEADEGDLISRAEERSVCELTALKEKIEEAMQINLKMREELLVLERKLIQKHREASERKQEKGKDLTEVEISKIKYFALPSERFFCCFRAPYFKFVGSAAPLNVDSEKLSATIIPHLQENDEWSTANITSLGLAVRKYILIEKVTIGSSVRNKGINKIFFKTKEFHKLKNASLSDLVKGRDDSSLDWKEIANYINRPVSAKECRQLWSLHIKPTLKEWSDEEHTNMLTVAKKHNLQNWDTIALELNTGRSGYECFLRHQNTFVLEWNDGKWSKEEETHLNNIIENVKIGNYISWDKVNYFMDTKFVEQIYAKWHGFQAPHLTRGHFTEREDRILLGMIHKFGADLKSVAAVLKNRSMAQLTARYKDHLLPQLHLKVGEWTFEEDEKLLNLVEQHGETKWATIAKHFQTRSRVQIRHRYKLLKQKITENPNINLKLIHRPKRPTSKKRAIRNKIFFSKVISANGKHIKSLLLKTELKPSKRSKTVDKKLTQYFQMKFKSEKVNDNEFVKRYEERNKNKATNSNQRNDYLQNKNGQRSTLSSALLFSCIGLRNLFEAAETDDWSTKDRTTFHRTILDLWANSNTQQDLMNWHRMFCSLFAAPSLLSHLELDLWKKYLPED